MVLLYRLLLRLYPASFRAEYGEEMTAVFARAAEDTTLFGRLALLLRTAADEIPNALAVHGTIVKQDLRYTARTLLRARGFALTAILVTALGVGANTAAFSVADFVLLRPLPFPDPEGLVRLCEGPRTGGGWGCNNQLSPANYRDFKTRSSSFDALGAFGESTVNLVGGGEPQRLQRGLFTIEMLPVLGVQPALGRWFGSAGPGDERVVILSDGLWQSQFGGDAAVLGRTLVLNGEPHTVIGVMPASFRFPNRGVQLWTLLTFREDDFANRNNRYIEGVGRLKRGVTFDQAHAELTALAGSLRREHPETNAETGISFYRMRNAMAPDYRLMLMALAGASLCLLVLTCANLANLLLARASARGREFALRAALGAGRERLVRQLVTEGCVLSLLGGIAGVVVAALGIPLFSSLVPPTMPLDNQPALNFRFLSVAAVFTGLTALGFGLLPALRAGGRTGFEALRDGTRTGGGRKQRLRAVFVTVEITMSVILLIACGLLIRAVWRVQAVSPGFTTGDVLVIRTALPRPKYDSPIKRGEFYGRVLQQVRALPNVRSAAYITGVPMAMPGGIAVVQMPGQPLRRDGTHNVSLRFATPQFFTTLGIPILSGRDIEDADTSERAWVAIVSESFVKRHWPGQDPLGKVFQYADRLRTVVGVSADIRVRGLERTSEPQMYLPATQVADGVLSNYDPKELVIRHAGQDVAALLPAVRQIVHSVDIDQPLSDVRSLDDVVLGQTTTRRAQLHVLGTLAFVALLLSGVGIHGLLAYTVSQRSQEIGVRLALGAERASVARLIVVDALRLATIGMLIAVPIAYAAGRGMRALLFGVAPGDPATIGAALALALFMTLAGSLVPVLRALRVSPMSVMRAE
jgi:putative ABC transport system permease protein